MGAVLHQMTSWVIVEDELWEINSYTNVFPIVLAIAFSFPDITSEVDGEKIVELVTESSTQGLQHSIESFEIKRTVSVPAPVEPESESVAEPKASGGCGPGTVLEGNTCVLAPEESSEGCGEGTVLVNGVCQLDKSSGTSMSIEPLYIIIGVVAIGGIIGAIAVARRGSKTSKSAKQDLEEYEEKYIAKEKPAKQKPTEKKETSAFCENCGKSLKPEAKFCGGCGTQRS